MQAQTEMRSNPPILHADLFLARTINGKGYQSSTTGALSLSKNWFGWNLKVGRYFLGDNLIG